MKEKRFIKAICLIFILLLIILTVLYFAKSGKYKKKDETSQLRERVTQQVYFLDDYIFSMANKVNNINLQNYQVKAENITEENDSESKEKQSGSEEKDSSENKSKAYQMEPSDLLVNSKEPDWETLKVEVERLYPSWATISIDLQEMNVNSTNIQNFSTNLDNLTVSVKEEDKENSLLYISKLYEQLLEFGNHAFENHLENSLLKTKYNILSAYSLIEKEDWNKIEEYLNQAEKEYSNIMNGNSKVNKYNINKIYLMLKEFRDSIEKKDKDILYIKYKNLLNEVNTIIDF